MTYSSKTENLYLRIDPSRIHFLKFLLEGYDGLAVLSTIDVHSGLVLIRYPRCSQDVLFALLSDVAADIANKI